MSVVAAFQPIYEIVLPTSSTVRAADVAPAAGLDIAVVGGIAAVVAGVLAFILHRRRGK